MQFARCLRDISLGAALLGILAGCSGGASSAVTAGASPTLGQPQSARQLQTATAARVTARAFADPDAASTGSVIVSTLGSGEVDVYTNTLKLAARITGFSFPEGLALDAFGNLYVANSGRFSPGIFVYKNDYKTQIATLADPFPTEGVAVDNATGLVAAMNSDPAIVGSVTFFTKGATTQCTTVTDANVRSILQGAFDKAGNLYVTAPSPDGIHSALTGVIRGGCSAKKITLLSTANTLSSFIFGIQVTRFGKIAIEDQGARAIYTYNPPVNGALGTPIATTSLDGAVGPYQFAFTENGAFLFVANEVAGKTEKYAYPAGGNPLRSFGLKTDGTVGLVVTPAAQ